MKRIILMVLTSIYLIPGWLFKVWLYGRDETFEKYSEEKRYALLQRVTQVISRRARIRIESYGTERLPKENGYILFPNHQGMFDPIIILATHGRFVSLIMKMELANTFIVKQVCHMINGKALDRTDVRQGMRVIKEMAEEVKQGRNYLIFAEGTRSKGNELLTFKGGSFKSAVYAKCPIVPVAVIDSYKAMDTNSIEPLTVQVHYLDPIYYDEYKGMKTQEIAEIVKNRIETTIAEFAPKKAE